MMGSQSGVSTRLIKEASHIVPIHCCAHRLELAIKDIWKLLPAISVMDNVIKDTYSYYKRSRVNWVGLQNTADSLELKVNRPVRLYGTR